VSMIHVHAAFWLAVAIVAVAAVVLFKVLFVRFHVPGLSTVAAAI
jgi:hypothetical protein